MRTVSITEYRSLMRDFLDGHIPATDFETRYLRLFKEDDSRRPQHAFQILDRLFADVDAFSPDPALRGDDGLDELELRAQVAAALRELDAVKG
ncbi:MAG TPA: colicin immunity domain-containing protein [Candidatus Dormibacteraeota bacterium]|nr:colicin immunity domain-containing protein [Candidatus Dormibacteraeota bacterium]